MTEHTYYLRNLPINGCRIRIVGRGVEFDQHATLLQVYYGEDEIESRIEFLIERYMADHNQPAHSVIEFIVHSESVKIRMTSYADIDFSNVSAHPFAI